MNKARKKRKKRREGRKFEKSDYKPRKVQLDLNFFCRSNDSDVIPNFLNFRLANFRLIYKKCQRSLLITEINLRVLKTNSVFSIAN